MREAWVFFFLNKRCSFKTMWKDYVLLDIVVYELLVIIGSQTTNTMFNIMCKYFTSLFLIKHNQHGLWCQNNEF